MGVCDLIQSKALLFISCFGSLIESAMLKTQGTHQRPPKVRIDRALARNRHGDVCELILNDII